MIKVLNKTVFDKIPSRKEKLEKRYLIEIKRCFLRVRYKLSYISVITFYKYWDLDVLTFIYKNQSIHIKKEEGLYHIKEDWPTSTLFYESILEIEKELNRSI